jgi:hypothetical protein
VKGFDDRAFPVSAELAVDALGFADGVTCETPRERLVVRFAEQLAGAATSRARVRA